MSAVLCDCGAWQWDWHAPPPPPCTANTKSLSVAQRNVHIEPNMTRCRSERGGPSRATLGAGGETVAIWLPSSRDPMFIVLDREEDAARGFLPGNYSNSQVGPACIVTRDVLQVGCLSTRRPPTVQRRLMNERFNVRVSSHHWL